MTDASTTSRPLFNRQQLISLFLPLVAEQALSISIGLADTLMVSSVGEAAVSGVSLVDSFNVLMIQLLSALATGGAVVASQYIGHREPKRAKASAAQIMFIMISLSVVTAVIVAVGRHAILRGIFGSIDADVMRYAETYFLLSALSYPFIGVYNAGAALFRAQGNSKISMLSSLVMNVVNIGGNAILIYRFGMGVMGAATASLVSRMIACFTVMFLLQKPDCALRIDHLTDLKPDLDLIKRILKVGIPAGIENGMFQIGMLLVAGLISTFGTSAIAANAICNNVGSMSNIPGSAIGLAMITVVGQCVGAKDYQQARHYTKTLLAAAYVSMGLLNIALFLLAPYLVGFYAMPQTTTDLALSVLQVNCVVTVLIWPSSFTLPNALRAAGDARFTMVTSMVSMWVFRIGMSYVLGAWLGMGLFGVWTAMQIDWAVRSLVFGVRFLGHKWEKARVLEG